jgi:hypothetical protein
VRFGKCDSALACAAFLLLDLKGEPMKPHRSVLLAGLIALTFSISATPAPSGAVMEKIPGVFPMDCAKWKDQARCEALNRNIDACRDKTDDQWRECMNLPASTAKFTPPKPRDCSTARNRERCEAYNGALAACKDQGTRAEHRKCTTEQLQGSPPKKN